MENRMTQDQEHGLDEAAVAEPKAWVTPVLASIDIGDTADGNINFGETLLGGNILAS